MQEQQREDWEQVACALGPGYLARWDRHDPDALEAAVGPVPRQQAEEPELVDAGWLS